ncbi:MAG: hypothetical protein AAFQ07_01605, partial [Chloroflexota bacterium]
MLKRITAYFDIQPSESTLVLLLIVHSFFVGMPRNLGNTVAITLFDASFLPQALVISAAVNALIAVTLNVLQKRLSFLRLGYLNLSIQFVSLLAF